MERKRERNRQTQNVMIKPETQKITIFSFKNEMY